MISQVTALDGVVNVFSFPPQMKATIYGGNLPLNGLTQTMPAVFNVPYGNYNVKIYNSEHIGVEQTYLPLEYDVFAEYRKPVTIRAKPVPITGNFRIIAPQNTKISVERIGGRLLDENGTPYIGDYIFNGNTYSNLKIELSRYYEGDYIIKASKQGYVSQEKRQNLKAGRTNIIIFNLMKQR